MSRKIIKVSFQNQLLKKNKNKKIDALSRRADYFDEKNKFSEIIFNAKKKRMKYNKKYFMITSKIEKNDALFKKIQKIIGKNQITKK